ncbi:MAG: DUF192 domain-containing protein [Actinomycetota bacterium]|nr:DUF192 domain-containing protein [Actinomycetota bacterium]
MRRIAPVILALGAALVAAGACSSPSTSTTTTSSLGGEGVLLVNTAEGQATLHVTIADTDALRERGLMGRTDLPAETGMAFLWGDQPTTSTFWMKDTLIPLSIAFWDASGRIVAIREMTPCTADPCPTYGAPVPYLGAAEANAGWFQRQGVHVGDQIDLTRSG